MKILSKISVMFILLPQNILGFIIWVIYRKKIIEKRDLGLTTAYILDSKFTGVSLGMFIFVSKYHPDRERTIKHEYGHFLQGIKLSWLYLIIVGLPSIIMNIISRFSYKCGKGKFAANYYNRWPENWADKLGNVER